MLQSTGLRHAAVRALRLAQVQGLEVRRAGLDMGVSLGFMGEVRRNVRLRDESFRFLRCWAERETKVTLQVLAT